MKKNLWIFAAAAMMLAACSNDDTIAQYEGDAINFRTIVEGLTRASSTSDVTTENISSFNVTAFRHGETTDPYINDAAYTKSSGTFTCTTKYYWPSSGTLDFYAYSVNSAVASQVAKQAYNSFTFTPATAANSTYADLVFATKQDIGKSGTYTNTNSLTASYGADGVPLNFRHTASKIAIQVKNTSSTMKFSVDGWKVGYLDGEGTFILSESSTAGTGTLAFSDWSANTTKSADTQYSSTFDATAIAAEASATPLSGEFILVPQRITAATAYANSGTPAANDKVNGAFIAVKLKIMNNDTNSTVIVDDGTEGHGTVWAIWPIGDDGSATFNWEPGKRYTYTVDLAGGGYYEQNKDTDADLDKLLDSAEIKFVEVTVDTWADQTAIDVPAIVPAP